MKSARKRVRPRNPVAIEPLLKKGGAHERKDEKAPRARQKTDLRRRLAQDLTS